MQYSCINELWDDHEGGGNSKGEKGGSECEPQQVLDFMEAHAAYKTNSIPASLWRKTHFFPQNNQTQSEFLYQLNTI
jgi:hypothetical protein